MWIIVGQFPRKAGWLDAPFVLRDFSRGNKQSWMCHRENLDRLLWKSRPFNMKISAVQHENLDCLSRKCRPFNMKILTVHHENLDCLSWKSQPFNMKISTVQHKNLDRLTWKFRPPVIKLDNFWPKWRFIAFEKMFY